MSDNPKWDQKYAGPEYLFGKQPNEFLADFSKEIPMGEVLCLGDGEGRNSVFLAEQGYRVTAVDISAIGIEKAKKLAKEKGVSIDFVLADLADFEIGNYCWKGVVSIFCHLPLALRQTLHRRCVVGLSSGGVMLLEAYTPAQLAMGTGGPSAVEMLMTKESVVAEFEGLNIGYLMERQRDVQEGQGHSGLSYVVQLCARK